MFIAENMIRLEHLVVKKIRCIQKYPIVIYKMTKSSTCREDYESNK